MSLSPEMPLVAVTNAIRYLGLFRLPAKTSLMSIKASWKTPLHQFQQWHNYSSFWNVFWSESPCRRGISLESGCRNVPAAVGWGGGSQRDHAVTPPCQPPATEPQPPSQPCGAPMCVSSPAELARNSSAQRWTKAKHWRLRLCWVTRVSPLKIWATSF